MKKLKVKISGTSPLLLHRYPIEEDGKSKKKDKEYSAEEDANKALYKDEVGCYIPNTMLKACIKDAGKNFSKGKSSFKDVVLSSVFVEEPKLYLGKKTYDEIDRRPVVAQRSRVVRSRPKFTNWSVEATIKLDDSRITVDKFKEIIVEAGVVKGIGDYRPSRGGEFGMFKVDVVEEVK